MNAQSIGNRDRKLYSHWLPTVFAFLHMYSGDKDRAELMATEALAEFRETGLLFEPDEMPIVLWECAVDVLQRNRIAGRKLSSQSDLERCLLELHPEQRLVFLLHSVFGLRLMNIALITGWSLLSVKRLVCDSTNKMCLLIGFRECAPPYAIDENPARQQAQDT